MSTEIGDATVIIGACGVCCNICRLYVSGTCTGCAGGNDCPVETVVASACPILRCAAAKRVSFCTRDCFEYPCTLFQHGLPVCEKDAGFASQSPSDQMPTDPAKNGVRTTRQELGRSDRAIQLHIFCLGPFRVIRNGNMITEAEWGQSKGPTHKVKALFALLVTRGAHGASKDEIVELLWGNQSAGEKSDARFHAALYYLRRALEPDLPPRIDSQFVIYQEGNYKLAPPDGYWLDAAAFEDYYNYALRLDEEGQPEVAARYYRMSEALYQGDYMAGLSPSYTEDYVNDCCQSQRHRLKDMNLIVLLRLAHYYLLHSQDHLSLQYAHKALTQDRACEEAHRLVMKLMHRAGHPRELARQYRSCERSLVESEDRGPSSKTAQLYQQFLQTP